LPNDARFCDRDRVLTLLANATSGEVNPVSGVLLALAIILVVSKVGGDLAMRVGQPAVLGELGAGILLGNLGLVGFHGLESIRHDPYVMLLAEIGVVLLLFEVGLASTVREMAKVGGSATIVAVLGVVTPLGLGWGVSALLLPHLSVYAHVFVGSALTATSVGITARVLRDLKRSDSAEGRIILGAAVIDDVLGLVVLATVGGIIGAANSGTAVSPLAIALIVGKAAGFLVTAVVLGGFLSPKIFKAAFRLRGSGVLIVSGLVICFLFSYAASWAGLAPIVGAFAAGLVLEPVHYQSLGGRDDDFQLEDLLAPVTSFLVPVFFVLMGLRVDLAGFANPRVLVLALALTLAAIVGKQACALGVGRGIDRLSIGLGMIPRGEVGLIFANLGLGIKIAGNPILDETTFSAIVIMVILTTMVTPPALRWSLSRNTRRERAHRFAQPINP
jgi:Kef-type K+ transport system membrane component KefB